MTCSRCGGLLHDEAVPVRKGANRTIAMQACFACGDRTDETIRLHRIFRREESIAERNERIWRQCRDELAVVTPIEVTG